MDLSPPDFFAVTVRNLQCCSTCGHACTVNETGAEVVRREAHMDARENAMTRDIYVICRTIGNLSINRTIGIYNTRKHFKYGTQWPPRHVNRVCTGPAGPV